MRGSNDRSEMPRLVGYSSWVYQMPCHDGVGDVLVSVPLPGKGDTAATPRRWLVALGDVTGRGAHAARLKAALESELARLARSETDPASLLKALNHGPEDLAGPEDFATMLAAILHGDRHELVLGNAGSIPPLLRRPGGRVEVLGEDVYSLPLWVLDGHEYGTITVPIGPGDVVVFASDGVPSVIGGQDEVFGWDRLQIAIARAPQGAESVGKSALEAVRRFQGGRAQADDITLLCLERTA